MSKRYDVCSPRPRKDSDKPYWHRVGTAFEGDKGINIVFDSLPLPDKEGRVSVALFEAKDKDHRQSQATSKPQASGARRQSAEMQDDMNDSIPF